MVFENSGISVYENKRVQPRVLIIDKEDTIARGATIVSENANMVKIKSKVRGRLVLKDLYYKGWKAYVDGKEVPIIPFENIFRMINIDRENTLITFKFEPSSFKYGVYISTITFLLTFLLLGLRLFKKI